jgi:hypothetical protein
MGKAGPLSRVAAKEPTLGSFGLVRKERLELSRVAPLEPKSSASTNSATFATPGTRLKRQEDRLRSAAARHAAGVCLVGREGFEPSTY